MPELKHDFLGYAEHVGLTDEKKKDWIKKILVPKVKTVEDGEHIIDWLISDKAPSRITRVSLEDAKKASEKWIASLAKKAEKITELPEDTETILDFGDGFRIAKLIGKNAFLREGFLMSHCVGSYADRKGTTIYSLRDKDNNPHCTIEDGQQCKGKGNGDIHPKYVHYVVKFLESKGMTMGDPEMRHLGYISVENLKEDLGEKSLKALYDGKYAPKDSKFYDKDDEEFSSLDLLRQIPLLEATETGVKLNFELPPFVKLSVAYLHKKIIKASGIFTKSHATSGNYAHSATSGYGAHSATSGNDANSATSGNDAHSATSGNYAHSATSGDRANSATSGYGAHSATSGNDAIAAAVGRKASAKGNIGCWLVIAEWEESEKDFTDARPIAIKAVKVDGKKVKADTWYKVKDGELVENKDV